MNTQTQKKETLFLFGITLSMLIWGFSWAAGKVVSGYGNTGSLAILRTTLSFLSLLAVIPFTGIKFKIARQGWTTLFAAALCLALYNFLFLKGLFLGFSGAGGVLVTTLNPLISYSITLFVARRKPTAPESIGLLIGLVAGAILLKVWHDWDKILNSGNLFFVGGSITWALLSFFTAKSARHGSPIAFSMWVYGLSSLLIACFTDFGATLELIQRADFMFWGNMIFGSVITTGFATTFFFIATSHLGASKASSFIFLVPFSAALGSWLFLHEIPHWNTILGGLLGIGAVSIIHSKWKRSVVA